MKRKPGNTDVATLLLLGAALAGGPAPVRSPDDPDAAHHPDRHAAYKPCGRQILQECLKDSGPPLLG